MVLNLYRRHSRTGNCAGGHAPDSQTYASDELRPKWRECVCPIYASGKLGANPKFRRNTQALSWAEAQAVAAAWEQEARAAPAAALPAAAPPRPRAGRAGRRATGSGMECRVPALWSSSRIRTMSGSSMASRARCVGDAPELGQLADAVVALKSRTALVDLVFIWQ